MKFYLILPRAKTTPIRSNKHIQIYMRCILFKTLDTFFLINFNETRGTRIFRSRMGPNMNSNKCAHKHMGAATFIHLHLAPNVDDSSVTPSSRYSCDKHVLPSRINAQPSITRHAKQLLWIFQSIHISMPATGTSTPRLFIPSLQSLPITGYQAFGTPPRG